MIDVDDMNYREHGFQLFRGALSGLALKVIQDAFIATLNDRIKEPHFKIGDGQVHRRVHLHRDYLADSIMHTMHPLIEKAAGEEIVPTYSYPCIYCPGSMLRRHVDRDACEFTATLTLKNEPAKVWPIYAELDQRREIEVLLNEGDLCFYDGRNRDHWRNSLPRDQYNMSIFLHYVKKDGKHAEWAKTEARPQYVAHPIDDVLGPFLNK